MHFSFQTHRRRRQPPATLGRMRPTGFTDLRDEAFDIAGKGRRRKIEVVPLDTVVTGIVLGGDEPGRVGNVQSALRQPGADFRTVGHGGEDTGIWPAVATGAGALVAGTVVVLVT